MTTTARPAGGFADRMKVRPLTTRERWVTFFVGFSIGPWLAELFPVFDGDIPTLSAQGLIPAAIAFEAGCVLLGCALFWLAGYALRSAATSPRAPRWLSRGMDPGQAK